MMRKHSQQKLAKLLEYFFINEWSIILWKNCIFLYAELTPLVLHVQYKHGKCLVKTKRQDESSENTAGIPTLGYEQPSKAIHNCSQYLKISVFSIKSDFFALTCS